MAADGWDKVGECLYFRRDAKALRLPRPPVGTLRRRTVREAESKRLLEDIWMSERTPDRRVQRELRQPTNIEVLSEL